jgi:hypothetical protein
VQDLEIPVYLRRGVIQTVYAGRPAAARMPPPAGFNGGTLSVGGWSIDITQPIPRLTLPADYRLVSRATINPLLGDQMGRFVNPMFPNSERAQGLLDVRVEYANQIALGEQIRGPQSGQARIHFNITEMDIANPLGSLMLGPVLQPLSGVLGTSAFQREQADTFRGAIRDAVVTLQDGQTTTDITLELVDPTQAPEVIGAREPVQPTPVPMRFQGGINLSDLSQSIEVNLPPQLLHRFIRGDRDRQVLAQIFPEGVPLSLRGTTLDPKIDFPNIGQRILEAQIRGLLPREGNGIGALEDILRRRGDRDRPSDPPPDGRRRERK